jgi:hypothetical protein
MMQIHAADEDPSLKKFRNLEYDRLESGASDPDSLHPGPGPDFLLDPDLYSGFITKIKLKRLKGTVHRDGSGRK